jgi:hypothetical protein
VQPGFNIAIRRWRDRNMAAEIGYPLIVGMHISD